MCQDYSCDDTIGYLQSNGKCLEVGTGEDGELSPVPNVDIGFSFSYYCFRKKLDCDHNRCPLGQYLDGCWRTSAGTCKDCEALPAGTFWSKDLSKTSPKEKGCAHTICKANCDGDDNQFISKACTSIADNVCSQCPEKSPFPNTYKKAGNACDNNPEHYSGCDGCTDPAEYKDVKVKDCTFDNTKARLVDTNGDDVRIRRQTSTETCVPCLSCANAPKAQGLPVYATDQGRGGMRCVTSYAKQCIYTYQENNFATLSSQGSMPWRRGYMRKYGKYNANINGQYSDTLPTYVPCPNLQMPVGYAEQLATPPGSDNYEVFKSEANDCSTRNLYVCAKGYYMSSMPLDMDTIVCEKCPNAPDSPGGLLPYCVCSHGFAKPTDIKALNRLFSINVNDPHKNYCVNCREDISMEEDGHQEALLCSSNTTLPVQRCSRETYLPEPTSTACVSCVAGGGWIPLRNKTNCQRCEAGTYSNGVECVPCNPRTEFCPSVSMTAPLIKRQNCTNQPGKMFLANTDNKQDNSCEECPHNCQEGIPYVYDKGHNASNGCSDTISGLKYFACYTGGGGSSPTDSSDKKFRAKYVYNEERAASAFVIEYCEDVATLPPHAAWVNGASDGTATQCTFSCKHGIRRTDLANDLLNRIRSAVYSSRIDLQPFLETLDKLPIQAPPSTMQAINKKVNWPEGITLNDCKEWERSVPSAFDHDPVQSRQYLHGNSFLFIDEVMAGLNRTLTSQLCLAPEEAYTTTRGCPMGFKYYYDQTTESLALESFQCALAARDRGVFQLHSSVDKSIDYETVVLGADWATILCAKVKRTEGGWIPYKSCSSCLQLEWRKASRGPIDKSPRLQTIASWLHPKTWYDYYISQLATEYPAPYTFADSGGVNMCDIRRMSSNTKFFSASDAGTNTTANIPCKLDESVGTDVCKKLWGSSTYKYSLNDFCVDSSPCVQCSAGELYTPSASSYSNISSLKLSWVNTVPSRYAWAPKSKICQYICPDNQVSNTNETAYATTPCIACTQIVQGFNATGRDACHHASEAGDAGAFFYSVSDELQKCRDRSGGLDVYIPECTSCSVVNPQLPPLVFAHNALFSSNAECLALCPIDLYRTLIIPQSNHSGNEAIAMTQIETLTPVPQRLIAECRLCASEHVIACNNSNCSANYYRNGSAGCIACNSSVCRDAGYYRTVCPANSISDSRCATCDMQRLLNNDFEGALKAAVSFNIKNAFALWEALNASTIGFSRRWLPYPPDGKLNASVFRSQEGCLVTCINNYAWIDFTTGLPPSFSVSSKNRELLPQYACIPCNSRFLGAAVGAYYSVWNQSKIFVPLPPGQPTLSPLVQMQGQPGACHLCPPNTETISSVDEMCLAKPGYGLNANNGVPVVLVTVTMKTDVQLSNRTLPVSSALKIMSLKTPAVDLSNVKYFKCCKDTDQLCKTFSNIQIDRDQNLLDANGAYPRCVDKSTGANYSKSASPPQRRLLQTSEELQSCLSGQYNHIWGSTLCFSCPFGASTIEPYEGISSAEHCACLSGYYAQRDPITKRLKTCIACGQNKRRMIQMNDSACEACPAGKITPTDTSANCYCQAGTYAADNGTCIECEAGGYCESGGLRIACPENSWSSAGAKTRSDCVCRKEGFYGSLANPESVCYKVPPTMRCDGTCECAVGWRPIYNQSADGLTVVKRCITECELGEYAVINPSTFQKISCEPCPLNTYSSSRQAVDPGGGRLPCTPCPPHFQTVSIGSVAPSQCACLSGVSTGSSECGSCPAESYLNTFLRRCDACPTGSTSPAGSVGPLSCMCGKGMRSAFRQEDGMLQCELCPLNMYSSSPGFSCTPCPQGMVTLSRGTTMARDCVCPQGTFKHAGVCVRQG